MHRILELKQTVMQTHIYKYMGKAFSVKSCNAIRAGKRYTFYPIRTLTHSHAYTHAYTHTHTHTSKQVIIIIMNT